MTTYKKMNPTYKKAWVEGLENGKYKQTTGYLRHKISNKSYGHCCLGVLCMVAGEKPNKIGKDLYCSFDNEHGELSKNLLKKFGLTNKIQQKLIDFNDVDELSFKDIAKWIRKNL